MAAVTKIRSNAAPSVVTAAADIGYGSTKAMVMADGKAGDLLWMPSGAAPAKRVNAGFSGEKDEPLSIEGVPYYAGFEPDGTEHVRHQGAMFAVSPDYHALYLETLFRLGEPRISKMVLGLPTREFNSPAKEYLKATFAGTFEIRNQEFTVDDVLVANQPLGSGALYFQDHADDLKRQRLLVIDIGYGTTDIALIVRGKVDLDHSTSTEAAMRAVCKAVAKEVATSYDFEVSPSQIDEAFRNGETSFEKWGATVDLSDIAKRHADTIAKDIVTDATGCLGSLKNIDTILVSGGGAIYPGAELKNHINGPVIVVMENPVSANLRGFLMLAGAHG